MILFSSLGIVIVPEEVDRSSIVNPLPGYATAYKSNSNKQSDKHKSSDDEVVGCETLLFWLLLDDDSKVLSDRVELEKSQFTTLQFVKSIPLKLDDIKLLSSNETPLNIADSKVDSEPNVVPL